MDFDKHIKTCNCSKICLKLEIIQYCGIKELVARNKESKLLYLLS